MRLYVDLETLQMIEGPGFRNPVTSLRFKRGDAARLDVTFLANGTTPAEIGDPSTLELRFGAKPRGRYDVGYLVHTSDWTLPDVGAENPLYQCSPSFNTTELDSAMQVGSAAGSELSELMLMGEITWREGTDEPTSTRTFLVVVENDVNRGTEGVPTDADPPYPAPELLLLLSNTDWLASKAVRYDAAQAPLDQSARDQFFTNFGATLAEEFSGPALRAVQLLDEYDSAWLTYDGFTGEASLNAGLLAGYHFSGNALFDSSPAEAINLDNRELIDTYGYPCANWNGSTFSITMPDLTVSAVATDSLMDTGYSQAADLQYRKLIDLYGSDVLEWQWGYATFFAPVEAMTMAADQIVGLYDGNLAFDIGNRNLCDPSGQNVFDWSGSEIYLNRDIVSGPYSFISDVFACYNGGSYLYGISDTIDLSTATSITVSGGIITGYA